MLPWGLRLAVVGDTLLPTQTNSPEKASETLIGWEKLHSQF
jgi:hypothetical protein